MSKHNVAMELVMVGRTADSLAQLYGSPSLTAFSHDLPAHAVVANIGAGRSNLGAKVAGLRPDVTWINVDKQYADLSKRDSASNTISNLHCIAGDVLGPSLPLRHGSVDRMYSWNMASHLLRQDRSTGLHILTNMTSLLSKDGLLCIGPVLSTGDTAKKQEATTLRPDQEVEDYEIALQALMAANHRYRDMYEAMRRSGVGIFRGDEFTVKAKGIVLADISKDIPEQHMYSPGSLKGVRLATKLALSRLSVAVNPNRP